MSYLRDSYDGAGTRGLRGTQRPVEPSLAGDERVILRTQGGYRDNVRPVWKLGRFFLTNQRLLFWVPTRVLWETPLSNIKEIKVEQQRYIAGRIKDVIAIGYQNPISQRPSKAWVIMSELETWRKELYGRTLLKIDQETLYEVLDHLEPQSREIVGYLWQNRHAGIDELAELIAAPAHMDVLLKIKGIINPTAERIIGYPLLIFERSRVDHETEEKILFSWWLSAPAQLAGTDGRGALVDVFDEGERIDVFAELPGVREEDIVIRITRDSVILSAQGEEGYYEEIVLPGQVNPDKVMRRYHNNILAVSLEKLRRWDSRTRESPPS